MRSERHAALRRVWSCAITLAFLVSLPSGCLDCDDQCDDFFYAEFEKLTPWENREYSVVASLDGRAVACTFTFPDLESSSCDDEDAFVSHETFRYYGAPKNVDLRLSLDDTTLAEASFEPAYEGTHGWDQRRCGSPCDEAGVMLAIP